MKNVKYEPQRKKSFIMGGCACGSELDEQTSEVDKQIYIPGLGGTWRAPDLHEPWTAEDEAWFDQHFIGSSKSRFYDKEAKVAAKQKSKKESKKEGALVDPVQVWAEAFEAAEAAPK